MMGMRGRSDLSPCKENACVSLATSGLRPAHPAIGAVLRWLALPGAPQKARPPRFWGSAARSSTVSPPYLLTSIAKSRVAALRAAPGATPPTASFGLLYPFPLLRSGQGPGRLPRLSLRVRRALSLRPPPCSDRLRDPAQFRAQRRARLCCSNAHT